MYLTSIHYLRGLAILFVVFGHCYTVSGWKIDSFSEKILANMITGGTHLFVFISGLLFHHIFFKKFKYFPFLKKKIKKVYLPYLILTIIGVVRGIIYNDLPFQDVMLSGNESAFYDYIKPIFYYIWTGRIFVGYWYIPFILFTFILSPIHIKIIKLTTKWQLTILLISLGISLFIHRPIHHLAVFQSVVYFFPIYLLGILCSIHRDYIYKMLEGKAGYFFIGSLCISTIQILYYNKFGNFHKLPFFFEGLDLMMLQKILFCFFLMALARRFENKEIPFLNMLARYSFPIFFLHPWIICFICCTNTFFSFEPSGILSWIFISVIVLISSLFITKIFQSFYKRGKKRVGPQISSNVIDQTS